MIVQRLIGGLVCGLSVLAGSRAQSPAPQPVRWQASIAANTPVKAGAGATIDLTGHVDEGWHVYALNEPSGGPIPLRIALDENRVAHIVGQIGGTVPVKKHDESFALETELYLSDFTLHVPVEVGQSAAGRQTIPLNVRFQACNDRICLPPRTVHLSAAVEVAP